MPQYLVSIYLPRRLRPVHPNRSDDRGDPRAQPRNDCCRRQEVRLRHFPSAATRSRCGYQPDGKVLVTDGPYTETKEHMGGFSVIWKLLIWTRHSSGRARVPSPAVRRARCARFLFVPDPKEATE
jgi:hypothetical protein